MVDDVDQKNHKHEEDSDAAGKSGKNAVDLFALFFSEEVLSASGDSARETVRLAVLHKYCNYEENCGNQHNDHKRYLQSFHFK